MKGGIVYGSAGALDGVIDRYTEQLGEIKTIVATGGLGRIIAPFCRHEIIIDNRLLLKGLGHIYRKNKEAQAAGSARAARPGRPRKARAKG